MPVGQLTQGVFSHRKKTTWRLHKHNEFPPSFTLLVTFHPSLPKASSYTSIQGPEPRHKPFVCSFYPSVTLQGQGLHNTDPCCPLQLILNQLHNKTLFSLAVGKRSEIPEQTRLTLSCQGLKKQLVFGPTHFDFAVRRESRTLLATTVFKRHPNVPLVFKHPI